MNNEERFYYLSKDQKHYMYPEAKLTERQKATFHFFYLRQAAIKDGVFLLLDYLKEINKDARALGESANILFQNELLLERAQKEKEWSIQNLENISPELLSQLEENEKRYKEITELNLDKIKELIQNFKKQTND